jgi:hypothetical protein
LVQIKGPTKGHRNRNKFINQIRAPGGHIQITIMIDTQQQYINLNILIMFICLMFNYVYMFQTIFLPHQHGRSALDTSRTLFLLASTQGVSRNRNKFINQIRAPGGHIQITIMIDTQQQYINLNIRGEISIAGTLGQGKRYMHIKYIHLLTYISGDSSPICKRHLE